MCLIYKGLYRGIIKPSKLEGHTRRPSLSHVVDIEINPLFLYISVVIEGYVFILRTARVRVDLFSLDFPQWNSHVVRKHKGYPVVVDEDVIRAREIISAHLKKKFTRNETIVSMNEMNLKRE